MSGKFFNKSAIKRVELGHDEKISRAAQMQIFALDRIAQIDCGSELVFHGGTSIAMMHGSPRWSEDLDFMASPRAIDRILGNIDRLKRAIELDCSIEMPGSEISLRLKGAAEGEVGRVSRIDLRWEHPMTFGVIKIKLEFYGCEPDALAAYAATPRVAQLEGHVARNAIASADLASIWGDKILAMAQRPVLKHRDQHDLGFIAPMIEAGADLQAAVFRSRDIYRLDDRAISSGLRRDVILDHVQDRGSFDRDMERWFGKAEFARMSQEGYLDRIFGDFHDQLAKALDLFPAPNGDLSDDCCQM